MSKFNKVETLFGFKKAYLLECSCGDRIVAMKKSESELLASLRRLVYSLDEVKLYIFDGWYIASLP